jgi:hypothetical protein
MPTTCSSCSRQIGTVFLDKIAGTFVRGKDGKRGALCSECQRAQQRGGPGMHEDAR